MNKRRLRSGAFAAASSLIVIAIAVVINMIVGAIPGEYTKYDTTGLGLYDLTPETEEIIKSVDEKITMYLVARDGMENQIIMNFLDRYVRLNSNITVKTVDPEVVPTMTDDTGSSHAISTMQENSVIVVGEKRSYEVSYDTIYSTEYSDEEMMMYYYYGQTPQGTTTFNAEQAITGAIDNVTTDNLPKIYMLEGHGEYELGTTLAGYLTTDNYLTEKLTLITGDGSIPEDASIILINAPASDINATELETLKGYVDNGGKLILITSYNVNGTAFTNLDALCNYYGMSVIEGLVMEANTQNYIQSPYYLSPNLSATDPITSSLEGKYVMMPTAQGIKVADTLPDGVTVSELLTTSADAYTVSVSGNEINTEDILYNGKCVIGAAATVTKGEAEGKFIWYSSFGVADDSADSMVSGGNSSLFLSTLGNLCEKKASVSIAGKAMDTEQLVVNAGISTLWTAIFVLIVPLATVIIGIVVWAIRRKK